VQGIVLKGESKVTIVFSTLDRASQNIKKNILFLRKWTPVGSDGDFAVFEDKDFRIVEIAHPLIFQDGLDKKLSKSGYPASLIIFASRHKSKDMRAILTVHSTGNANEAKFGGTPKKLSQAAPKAARSLIRSLKTLTEIEEYEVTLECTHHGPSDLDVPSVFIEIGSNEEQWLDEVAGRIVAHAILLLKDDGSSIAVGFGGTHYAPRQTSLILSSDITFGHIFPTYSLNDIDESMIRQAFTRSNADFAYLDRKSMKGEERDNLIRMIERIGFEVKKESDIKEMDNKRKNYKSRDAI
jgi:D-aminoacyl-tRNA deacylase